MNHAGRYRIRALPGERWHLECLHCVDKGDTVRRDGWVITGGIVDAGNIVRLDDLLQVAQRHEERFHTSGAGANAAGR